MLHIFIISRKTKNTQNERGNMIQDLLNMPVTLKVGEMTYKMEYDNKAYAELEMRIGKSIFYIYDELIIYKSLKTHELLEMLCCGLLKHYSEDEIEKVKKSFKENISLFMQNYAQITYAFLNPLLPAEVYEDKGKNSKKS